MPQDAASTSFGWASSEPRREFLRREPAEHHGMDRPDARAREHREHRLRDHRHVDDHAVALHDSSVRKDGRQCCDLVFQLREGDRALCTGDGAVVLDRDLVAARAIGMAIDRVIAGVADGIGEPRGRKRRLPDRKCGRVDAPSRSLSPRHAEGLGVTLPGRVGFEVAARHRVFSWRGREGIPAATGATTFHTRFSQNAVTVANSRLWATDRRGHDVFPYGLASARDRRISEATASTDLWPQDPWP